MKSPLMTHARLPLTGTLDVINEHGQRQSLLIPAERALTVYVDKRELVTLMTLGAYPEYLVLGYLCNQRLVSSVQEVAAVSVDWDVGAAAVQTVAGLSQLDDQTAKRAVTTGCGQGSMFGAWLEGLDGLQLPASPPVRQSQLQAIAHTVRLQNSIYKQAGSVHGCALFQGSQLLMFVEDVGRHNAVDSIAGWMGLQQETDASGQPRPMSGHDKVFYTTGRLTSEMVIKAALMGIPVVVSRSGMTQMGLEVAERVGLCAVGRVTHQRLLCFTHPQRLLWDAMPV